MPVAELSLDMTIGMTLASLHEQRDIAYFVQQPGRRKAIVLGALSNLLFNGT